MKLKHLFPYLPAALLSASTASAQVTIADWTFETTAPTTAGPISPEAGSGSATAVGLGTISSPVGNASAHSFSANGWTANSSFFQFSVSTTGFSGIQASFDQTGSNTGPANFDFEYSTDGVNFSDFASYTIKNDSWSSGGTRKAASNHSFDLSSVAELNNVSTVYFRVKDTSTTAITGGTVGTAGTGRIDNFLVTASGTVAIGGAPQIFSDVQSTNVSAGRTITLSVTASGSDPLSYQWYHPDLSSPLTDNGIYSGSTTANLTINDITTNEAGAYQVIISNDSGSITSSVANVTVSIPVVTNIAHLRTLEDSVNWAPTDTNTLFTVQGTVTTVVNATGAGNAEFFIQDDTGGISVFVRGGTFVPDAGSIVQVTGPLGQFDGLLELNLDANNPDHSVDVIGGGPLPTPQPFSLSSLTDIPFMESTEGSLVIVSNVFLGSTNTFFVGGSAGTVTLTNLTGQTMTLFLNANQTDIIGQPIPQFASSIIGVLGQFKSSAPFTSGYELDITQFGDLVPGTPPPPVTLPIPLSIHMSGNNVVLTWSDASFALQSSTNISGPFNDIPAAAGLTTYAEPMTNGANFYRLIHP